MFETTRPNQNRRKSRNSRAARAEVRPGSAALASSRPPSVSRAGASRSFDVIESHQSARAALWTQVLRSHDPLAAEEHRAWCELKCADVLRRLAVPYDDIGEPAWREHADVVAPERARRDPARGCDRRNWCHTQRDHQRQLLRVLAVPIKGRGGVGAHRDRDARLERDTESAVAI